ncbi:hypothetical protein [Thermomonas sp.]|uniref:hypothetical protein n=1 Tax=Thermomonas sp. TaxID=1971895 RepID=UPI001E0E1FF1|nr:hypothetical protein [Thermomonas sp.]MBZ0088499.1 hypothetical protein [Thermomonas sp.]HRO64337.1 hypothetical protein [Thermomonas sp.]
MNPTRGQDLQLAQILDQVLAFSAACQWRGHDKHDGLNSPLLRALCGWSRPTRILALQGVMRFPVDLRTLLRVPKVHNPKGLALFLQTFVQRWRAQGRAEDLHQAEALCALLEGLRSAKGAWSGQAWGYQYPWQDLGFFAPRGMPNAVVTCFVCEALLDLHAANGQSRPLQLVEDALPFLLNDLPILHQTDNQLCLGYMPLKMHMRVMDVSILIGALLARLDAVRNTTCHPDTARRLVRFVVDRQTAEGAWWYTDPPEASPVRIDNYHTGFILDALWRYMHATGDFEWMPAYQNGLAFYAARLFESDGAPRWMSDQRYPHDVHGSAQGILTFSRHQPEFPELAERIAAWAIRHLYDGKGAFWYRQTRWRIQRTFFLRWNNGWMARALSSLLPCPGALPDLTERQAEDPGPHDA